MTHPSSADVQRAVTRAAELFSEQARETILCENLYKHAFEVESITRRAGSAARVCDLGGGLGVNLLALRMLGHSGRLVLIDRFDEYDELNRMGSFGSASRTLADHDIECIRHDFWARPALPLADDSIDVATCFDVIEHLPGHPLRQLAELRRLLVPNGFCIISGPNSVSLMKRVKLAAGRYPYSTMDAWLQDTFYEHYREYSPVEYGEVLRRAGFGDVEVAASAVVTNCRARMGYHRHRLPAASPRRLALWALAAIEGIAPNLRHMVYAWGVKPAT